MPKIAPAALTALLCLLPGAVSALAIYPIDRAQILAGSRFDLKVEFDDVLAPGQATITVNPATLHVSRRLAIFFSDFPDHYETAAPKLDGPFVPTVAGPDKTFVANPQYREAPGATLRAGNLPRTSATGVHTAEDVVLTGMGPGSELIAGFLDNTDVFRIMAEALGLAARPR